MDGWRVRSAAIGCAFASCAMVVGPGVIGTAQANAGIFGFDFFGDDDKSDMHHPRPGSEVSAQSARIAAAEPQSAAADTAAMRSVASVPEVEVARAAGGGGGAPRVGVTGRATNLARVSTAPSARTVVVRRATGTVDPASALPTGPRSPVVALAAPPDEPLEPESRPAPVGPRSPAAARGKDPLAPGGAGAVRVPDSFRVGYAEYLRSADTGDLVVAALPGIAGITGFTLIGAYAGYRQAKALQRALLAPVPTSILL